MVSNALPGSTDTTETVCLSSNASLQSWVIFNRAMQQECTFRKPDRLSESRGRETYS